jgi:hypothetical protein
MVAKARQTVATEPEIRAHHTTAKRSIGEIAKSLQGMLGTGLLMYMLDIKDPKTITRWANGQVESIRSIEVERRLRAIDQTVEILLEVDSPTTIRGWFFGMDPTLNDESPVDVIRQGRLSDALSAAASYVALNW